MKNSPPKLATKLLRYYCREEILEDLEGDLFEFYQRNIESKGLRKAQLIYWIDVLKFFRLYTIKKPKSTGSMFSFTLLYNYFLTALRNLRKNKAFGVVNLVGLSLSLGVCMVVAAFIYEVNQFDKFNKNYDQLYRVSNQYTNPKSFDGEYATTGYATYPIMRDEVPGVSSVVLLISKYGSLMEGEDTYTRSGFYSTNEFFDIFSFPMIEGNQKTALEGPNKIILTKKTANDLFGKTSNLLGETVYIDKRNYIVSGLINTEGIKSHLNFDFLLSHDTYKLILKAKVEKDSLETSAQERMNWADMWFSYVYITLEKKANPEKVQSVITTLSKRENKKLDEGSIQLKLYHLSELFVGTNKSNEIGLTIEKYMILIVIVLALTVLLVACINYMNLTIARSLSRYREIGIRKAVGARKSQIFKQFITESLFYTFVSALLGYLIYFLVRDEFISYFDPRARFFSLDITWQYIIIFFFLVIIIGVLGGLVPSFILSRLDVGKAIKGQLSGGSGKSFWRVGLMGIQFILSVGFIVATSMVYRTYEHSVNFDLGYNTENVLTFYARTKNMTNLVNELNNISEVNRVSHTNVITSSGSLSSANFTFAGNKEIRTFYSQTDSNYIKILRHKLLAGNDFSQINKSQIIVNEEFMKAVGYTDADSLIGEKVLLWNDSKAEIIGVLENFHFGTVKDKIEPFSIVYEHDISKYGYGNLLVSFISDKPIYVRKKIENLLKELNPDDNTQVRFYSEILESAYYNYLKTAKVIAFLSILIVSISLMGFIGMVVNHLHRSYRNICIRKVLGAELKDIIYNYGRAYMVLLLICMFIGVGFSFYMIKEMFLIDILYKPEFTLTDLFGAAVVLILLGMAFTFIKIVQLFRRNPSDVLRSE